MCLENISSTLRWEIRNFGAERRIISPEYMIRGFFWKLEIRKKLSTTQPHHVLIYLHRTSDNDDNQKDNDGFACIAFASIKLMSFDENVAPYECCIPASEFGGISSKKRQVKLLSLRDIENPAQKYIENGKIILEVEIIANPPIKVIQNAHTALEILSNKNAALELRLNITNVDQLMTMPIMSPAVNYCNALWRICAFKRNDTLALFVEPIPNEQLQYDYGVDVTFKLNGAFNRNFKRTTDGRINPDSTSVGFLSFIEWDAMIKRFVRDNELMVDIRLEAKDDQGLQSNDVICPVCMESLRDQRVQSVKCGHMFCQECMDKGVRPRKKCAVCNFRVLPSQIRDIYFS